MMFILKLSWGMCVRILAVLLGMWHDVFVVELMILSNFLMSGFEKGTT